MVPNIAGTIASSPKLISGLIGVFQQVHGGSFTGAQIQTLLLTNAVTNGGTWAVAFPTPSLRSRKASARQTFRQSAHAACRRTSS